ncbi:MAG: pyrroloquinoline quinone-dependent dehydrogenase [Gammaproteobacteria bacterium]|jgi:quinoprotein glucose dehydrogenase|nr:pyrroloquinoline quinone-dependent dehydrogenase [Gammaproteobacteria bacterium]|tara:strand:- start:23511 stop:25532 length:2022 start_codon:yes stop_codon:yes gene_type:complete
MLKLTFLYNWEDIMTRPANLNTARINVLRVTTLTVLLLALTLSNWVFSQEPIGEWRAVAGDKASTKYSPLDQISANNIANLQEVWTWNAMALDTSTGNSPRGFRSTPLKVGDRLYVSTNLNLIAALDPATGEQLWVFDPKAYEFEAGAHGGLGSRGVAYWSSGAGEERIVFATGGMQLLTLDPATGELDSDFGVDGYVDLTRGLGREISRRDYNMKSPPTICGDTIVLGSVVNDLGFTQEMPPGHVRGYDVRTGEMKWVFHTIPQTGELGIETWENQSWQYTGNTNVWSWTSCDEELGYVYLPIGTPSDDWYGGHRLGDNLFAESLVAVDADTGERIWHFQAVHHGVWDYDFPTAPNLVDIVVDGEPIKAVAQVSKQAFTYVFNRETGEPVWPIVERPVPQSTVPGERLSPTQPFPTRPPPFDRQGVTIDDLIDFTPELRQEALEIIEDFVIGPLFTPTIVAGQNGKQGVIQLPGLVGGANMPGGSVDPETGYLYIQSSTYPWVTALEEPDPEESDLTYRFENWTRVPPGPQGLPLLKPPYSRLTAIDLNRGEVVWQIPHGDGPRARVNELIGDGTDIGPLGWEAMAAVNGNSPLVTKSLLFVNQGITRVEGSSQLGFMRAFDKATGALIWERPIETAPRGFPMTYLHDGKQYLVFGVGGGDAEPGLRAYALP